MSNFLSRLKSNQATSPGLISPTKSKSNAPLSPIESILKDNRPLRSDGSDKFFGMHNPSNTCYCNSVLQCLYYSEPFRKHVIEFPLQTVEPSEVQSAKPKLHLDVDSSDTVAGLTPLSPVRSPADNQHVSGSRSPLSPSTTPTPSTSTSTTTNNDNKDSFDNRKKQIMAIGPHIRMETSRSEQYGMPESLYTGLKDIFEAIIADKWRMGVVVPAKFMETLRHQYEVYRSPQHQDAHEFLNLLLNEVVEQVEKYSKSIATAEAEKNGTSEVALNNPHSKASTSWVHELFEGTLTSETRCLTCETISRRDEVFLDLSVDLEEHTSVTACLKKFSQEEMLCEKNKFHCDNCCGLQEAEKRMKIKRLPHILALHLKRFKYVEDSGRLQKLFHRVVFPFHLRLLNTTDDAEDADRLYELYAIIVHLGTTPFQGHYVSIIKTKDRGWLLFDDELVLPVDAQYIRNFFGGDSRNPACAYVLFYTKTTDEAMQREQNPEEESEDEGTKDGIPTINEVGLMSPTESGVDEHVNSANGLTSPKLRALEDEEDLMTALPPPMKKVTSAKPRTPTSPARQPSANLTGNNRTSLDGHNQARGVPPDSTQQVDQEEKQEDKLTSRHSAMRSGALSRFRNSSLSLKSKPRLWGKSDRADSRESEDAAGTSEAGLTLPNLERGQSEPEQPAIKSKPSRFGLGRKKSMNLLSRKE